CLPLSSISTHLLLYCHLASCCSSPTENYSLSLHDALPISAAARARARRGLLARPPSACLRHRGAARGQGPPDHPVPLAPEPGARSEEHTSELQSRFDLVCRLLLEKKKQNRRRQKYRRGSNR